MVQVGHDGLEVLIHLFEGPVEAHGVLAHLQGGGGHTAGVGRGISAGCVAVRGDGGKSGFDYGLRKGCGSRGFHETVNLMSPAKDFHPA